MSTDLKGGIQSTLLALDRQWKKEFLFHGNQSGHHCPFPGETIYKPYKFQIFHMHMAVFSTASHWENSWGNDPEWPRKTWSAWEISNVGPKEILQSNKPLNGIIVRHGLFAEYIFAGNSDGNFKFAGNLPAKTANFLLSDTYHSKLLKRNRTIKQIMALSLSIYFHIRSFKIWLHEAFTYLEMFESN